MYLIRKTYIILLLNLTVSNTSLLNPKQLGLRIMALISFIKYIMVLYYVILSRLSPHADKINISVYFDITG
jgi:hypothetical protein